MKLKGWRQLKQNKNRGVSLAVVLCVSAFFVAFSAAILYTAGLLTSQSTRRLQEERCYQLASSYAKVLDAELKQYDQKNDSAADGTFYRFVNQFLDDSRYLEYDRDYAENTSYKFVVSGTEAGNLSKDTIEPGYGNICVTLRKEPNEESVMNGEIPVTGGSNYEQSISSILNTTVRQYIVIVDVTAYYGEMSYTYTTEYTREETYAVRFSHNGTTIVWDADEKCWKVETTVGAEYDPSATAPTEPIKYTYDQSSTTSCRFIENSYVEGGSGNGS